jgi:hypothetical protein
MDEFKELTISQKIILIGHVLETCSAMLIVIGSLLKRADDLPEGSVQQNKSYENGLYHGKLKSTSYWDS